MLLSGEFLNKNNYKNFIKLVNIAKEFYSKWNAILITIMSLKICKSYLISSKIKNIYV